MVRIGVVGPCGAGKSTLVQALRARGIAAREIAQEHSGVPAMWQRVTRPDRLVYLDVSRETAEQRLARELPPAWWEEMTARLEHARAHADLVVMTDNRTPKEVLEQVLAFLDSIEPDRKAAAAKPLFAGGR
jgi:thymidylate kinase